MMTPFHVLVVCTGNICRSPAAQLLLQHHLDEATPGAFAVSSAGTQAVVGSGVHRLTAAALTELGHHPGEAHEARQLTAEILDGADLVLTAARDQRVAAAVLHGATLARVFTLLEFARLASTVADEAGDLADLVERARRQRGLSQPQRPDADDLPDPISGDAGVHRRTVELIDVATRAIATALASRAPRVPVPSPGRRRRSPT